MSKNPVKSNLKTKSETNSSEIVHSPKTRFANTHRKPSNKVNNSNRANSNNDNNDNNSALDTVHKNIKTMLGGVDIDLSTVLLYTAKTMEFVELFDSSNNRIFDKKYLVVNTIYKMLNDNADVPEEEEEFVRFMLDSIVESIVKTSRKEIRIKAKTKSAGLLKNNNKLLTLSIGETVETLHTKCITIIRQNKYDTNNILINIPVMVGMVMSITERSKQLKGAEKKAVIIKVIKRLLTQSIHKCVDITESDNKKINLLLKILPELVDILIEVSNHKYNLNVNEKCFKKFIKKLSCK